ncbi:MAG: Sec-independent protein translocase subunit TatA/TatB [Candidatus Dormibacterales bacterium]
MPFLGGGGHIYIILGLIIVLIIFGPGKLPELGGAIGRGIKEFRKAGEDLRDEVTRSTQPDPAQSAPAASSSTETPAPPATTTPPNTPSN